MKIQLATVISVLPATLAARGAETAERFGLFEAVLSASGACANPYLELAAEATLTAPEGRRTRTVPLFWDGGAT